MNSFDYFLGIDPGKTGGLALLSQDRGIEATTVMGPIADIINWLRGLPGKRSLVILEKCQVFPKNGAVGMFHYGTGYGEIMGALTALGLPYMTVHPATWTKVMHAGLCRKASAKERSLIAARQLFPSHDFRASDKCKNQHEGLIDAVLIAEYGRLQYGNQALNS